MRISRQKPMPLLEMNRPRANMPLPCWRMISHELPSEAFFYAQMGSEQVSAARARMIARELLKDQERAESARQRMRTSA